MNEYIYYKITAEDTRFNTSSFSEILKIQKPDKTPPSPPVIDSYEVAVEGVQLSWTPSSSKDVKGYVVYRKNDQDTNSLWEAIAQLEKDVSNYTDQTTNPGNTYAYTLVALDQSGLESTPANPVSIGLGQDKIDNNDIKFTILANREQRFIQLSWKVKEKKNVSEYRIYKAEKGQAFKLYQVLDNTLSQFQDQNIEAGSEYRYGLQVLVKDGMPSGIKEINVIY